ncbi:MAG: hypothetical protein WAL47_03695 [Pyrinomonadaceae bacterium]
MRGFSTFTVNDGPWDGSERLAASSSSGRDRSQTRPAMQAMHAINTSTMMISDVFLDPFMPTMIVADCAAGQMTAEQAPAPW